MKKNILKLVFILFTAFIIGCSGQKEITNDIQFGASMKVSYTMVMCDRQIDSLCEADTLPSVSLWKKNEFTDYETNSKQVKRLYIKKYTDETESIYILLGEKEPYVITRRITY